MFKNLPRVDGPITTAIRAGVRLRSELIAGGMPEMEANRIVGAGLKAVMGNNRHLPWRFYCNNCRDTGWVEVTPRDMQRLERIYGKDAKHQTAVEPCEPCLFRQKQREERRRLAGNEGDDDFESAGRTRKRFQ